MSEREDERNAYLPEERADIERILARFERGDFGVYGNWDTPGLIDRLEETKSFWERRKSIGSRVTQSTGYLTNLELSDRQLNNLLHYCQSELDNMRIRYDDVKRDPEADIDRYRDLLIKEEFLKDLKKSCQEGLKLSTKRRLEEIQALQEKQKNEGKQ